MPLASNSPQTRIALSPVNSSVASKQDCRVSADRAGPASQGVIKISIEVKTSAGAARGLCDLVVTGALRIAVMDVLLERERLRV